MTRSRLSQATLVRLAEKAATLEERLGGDFVAENPDLHQDAIKRRVAVWARKGAQGDEARLRESLAWRGIDLNQAMPFLGRVNLKEGAPLPEWISDLRDLLGNLNRTETSADFLPDGMKPLPHQDIIIPFVEAASQMLPPDLLATLGAAALKDLKTGLFMRLIRLCWPVLDMAFRIFDMTEAYRVGELQPVKLRFTAAMLIDPIPEFLVNRPVLARLLVVACKNWRDAAEEFGTRLAGDLPVIADHFFKKTGELKVDRISVGDADLHDGHREVLIVSFTSGERLVYKPRSLGLDQAYADLLQFFQDQGLAIKLAAPRVLLREGYGWAEFVTPSSTENAEDIRHYFEHAGALVALSYALGASDLHSSNLIASNNIPIPIDLETMLSAIPRPDALLPEQHDREHAIPAAHSVVSSMLLSWWKGNKGYPARNLSGLFGEMLQSQETSNLPSNRAMEDLVPLARAPLLRGFETCYRFMLRHQAALSGATGPLSLFGSHPVRLVMRDTSTYMRILISSIQDDVMSDAIDRGIALECVNHTLAVAAAPRTLAPMINAEVRSLTFCDVPRFTAPSSESSLHIGHQVVAHSILIDSPVATARAKISLLSMKDLLLQQRIIQQSLISRLAAPPRQRQPISDRPPSLADHSLARAHSLGKALVNAAHVDAHGHLHWPGLSFDTATQRYNPSLNNQGFADGTLGIILFFAALGEVGNYPEMTEVARKLFSGYGLAIDSLSGPRTLSSVDLTNGSSGVAFGLSILARLWPHEPNIEDMVKGLIQHLAPASLPQNKPDIIACARQGLRTIRPFWPEWVSSVMEEPVMVDLQAASGQPRLEGQFDSLPGIDSYGLGTAGLADQLITMGKRDRAIAVMEEAISQTGEWRLVEHFPDAESYGLQHGLAGIGYVLLRLVDCDRLPSLTPLRLQQAHDTHD